MKNKLLKVLAISLVSSILLTGCQNPIESIKGMFSKDDSDEEQIPLDSLEDAEDSLTVANGEVLLLGAEISADMVITGTPADKMVEEAVFVGSDGTQTSFIDTSSEGDMMGYISVWYTDGSQDTIDFYYVVQGSDMSDSSADAPSATSTEFPSEWKAAIDSGDYKLVVTGLNDGSNLSYLKPNVNVAGSVDVSVNGSEQLYYNEESGMAYSMYIVDEYSNLYSDMIDTVISMADTFLPSTEEEFNEAVADGNLEVGEGVTYEQWKADFDGISNVRDVIKTDSNVLRVGSLTVNVEETTFNLSTFVDGAHPYYMSTTAYTQLPDGRSLCVNAYPLDGLSDGSGFSSDDKYGLDIGSIIVGGQKVDVEEDKLAKFNEGADAVEGNRSSASRIINEAFMYVAMEDYSSYLTASEPEPEPEVNEPTGTTEVTHEESITTTTTTTTSTTGASQNDNGLTYQQKYPTLFTWPDQQAIYGMEPKKLVYDLLSVKDTSSGEVTLEGCLIPIWGKKENGWINDMSFDLSSAGRQNANTTVNPVAQTGQSGLFSSGSSSSSSSSNKEDKEDKNLETVQLTTSFGTFNVTSTPSIKVDTGKSTRSQVYLTDSKNNGYRILSTTQSSIDSNKESCIYTIQDLQDGSWSCKRGATETIPVGVITRYYMQYISTDGEQHTAEYMYVIETGSGFLLVLADKTPTTTSDTMYSICKMVTEATE